MSSTAVPPRSSASPLHSTPIAAPSWAPRMPRIADTFARVPPRSRRVPPPAHMLHTPGIARARSRLAALWNVTGGPTDAARQYRRAFGALALNQLGDGLAAGGLFILVQTLGAVSPAVAVGCMATMELLETLLAVALFGYAALMRDEAFEKAERGDDCEGGKQRARTALWYSGLIDSGINAGLFVTAICVAFGRVRPRTLFSLLTLARVGQSANLSYETAAYSSLRAYLIEQEALRRNVYGTLCWSEMAVGCTLMSVGRWGTYMVALALSSVSAPLFLAWCIGSLALSVVLTGVPKMRLSQYDTWRTPDIT